VKTTLERELKLDLPEGFELPRFGGDALASRVFTSTYYDTPPRSLTRAGITLRRRLENGVSRWQLKLPRGEGTRWRSRRSEDRPTPPTRSASY
jgi:inorganic triphosphatase YgiF